MRSTGSSTRLAPPVSNSGLRPPTSLLAKIYPEEFTKSTFLTALEAVCCDASARAEVAVHLPEPEETFSRLWREQHPPPKGGTEVLTYNLTSVLFFGVISVIPAPGRDPDHQQRLQVSLRPRRAVTTGCSGGTSPIGGTPTGLGRCTTFWWNSSGRTCDRGI